MSAYVLIVVLVVYGGSVMHSVPFATQEACEKARDAVVKAGYMRTTVAECYPTDHGRTRQ